MCLLDFYHIPPNGQQIFGLLSGSREAGTQSFGTVNAFMAIRQIGVQQEQGQHAATNSADQCRLTEAFTMFEQSENQTQQGGYTFWGICRTCKNYFGIHAKQQKIVVPNITNAEKHVLSAMVLQCNLSFKSVRTSEDVQFIRMHAPVAAIIQPSTLYLVQVQQIFI